MKNIPCTLGTPVQMGGAHSNILKQMRLPDIKWIHKWISLHPKQWKLVLLVHLAQVICRQGLEQRNQYPVLLDPAEVKQEARP